MSWVMISSIIVENRGRFHANSKCDIFHAFLNLSQLFWGNLIIQQNYQETKVLMVIHMKKLLLLAQPTAGTAAPTNQSHHPEAEIDVYEKNDNVSFFTRAALLYQCKAEVKNIGFMIIPRNFLSDEESNISAWNMKWHMWILKINNHCQRFNDWRSVDCGVRYLGSPRRVHGQSCHQFQEMTALRCQKLLYTCEGIAWIMPTIQKIQTRCCRWWGYIGTELVEAFNVKGRK